MKKCHKCGSRFTVIAYIRRKDGPGYPFLLEGYSYVTTHLCRTCAFEHAFRISRLFSYKAPLIIPFVKMRIWFLSDNPI